MRLWSLTDQDCWTAAKQRGFFVNDKSYVDPHFVGAYEWMHDRVAERCPSSPDFAAEDSVVWCRPICPEGIIKLKPVSEAADEVVLAWLDVDCDTVSVRLEVLQDFPEVTSPYHDLTVGPVKVDIRPGGDACVARLRVQHNPALVKLSIRVSDQAGVHGEHAMVELVPTQDIWTSPEWTVYTMFNGQERAHRKELCYKWHRILVEFKVPDSEVLLSSEDAFTCIIDAFGNSRHQCWNWQREVNESDMDDDEWRWDAPLEERLENYKGIFHLDKLPGWMPEDWKTTWYAVQGCVQGVPLANIKSVWHTLDVSEDNE